jgi:hypothetical protein
MRLVPADGTHALSIVRRNATENLHGKAGMIEFSHRELQGANCTEGRQHCRGHEKTAGVCLSAVQKQCFFFSSYEYCRELS